MRGNALTSRIAAYVASGALVVSGAVLAGTPAEAVAHDPIGANQGAAWLESQLTNGLLHNPNFGGFDDYGLTIDTGLALDSVGGHDAAVQSISEAIAANIGSYIGTGDELYSGSAAKSAVLAQEAGDDPTDFGGVDLIDKVESTVSSTSPIEGRLEDQSDFGDFAKTLGQALAARALDTAGSSQTEVVTDFLLEQQCSTGYFRLNFSPKEDLNQSCVTGTDAADTDATAYAVLHLQSQSSDPDVAAALTLARTWLAGEQKTDGSWGGGTSTEGSNANSTGLAAWALGDTSDSEQAAQWLRTRQVTDYNACDKLAGERGAVAYDNAGLAAGRSNGITTAAEDQWRRASAQAVPALTYLPLDTTPSDPVLTGPGGYLKAGTRQILRTTGVAPGDQLCLTGVGAAVQGVASSTAWQKAVILPAGTATRVYRVRDSFGHADTRALKVLGRKSLSVTKSKNRVKRSRFVTATINGLAPGELARIYYKGALVKRGSAGSQGKFAARFKVGRARGKKRIVGFGQFSDIRRGATTIRVVR